MVNDGGQKVTGCWGDGATPCDVGVALPNFQPVGQRVLLNESGLIPVEYTVLVELDPAETKTAGGIILTKQTVEADEISAQQGMLVAASPLAFTYEHWPEGSRKPELGDRVLFRKYAGGQSGIFKKSVDGVERAWRVMNDKDIIAIVEG